MSPAPAPTAEKDRIHSRFLILLVPSPFGLLFSFLSESDRSGVWWLFAQASNSIALLTIAVAALYALVSSARRKISGAFLGFLFVELSAAAILYWWQLGLSKILLS
jgi:hypothetical protein